MAIIGPFQVRPRIAHPISQQRQGLPHFRDLEAPSHFCLWIFGASSRAIDQQPTQLTPDRGVLRQTHYAFVSIRQASYDEFKRAKGIRR